MYESNNEDEDDEDVDAVDDGSTVLSLEHDRNDVSVVCNSSNDCEALL